MQITTNEFELSKGEYFAICAADILRKRWLYSVAITLLIVFPFIHSGPFGTFLFLGVFLYPIFVATYVWSFAGSPDNRIIYETRRYELDEAFIRCFLSDGSHSELRYLHVVRARMTRKHFLLVISRSQMIIIPFRAFHSAEDVPAFEKLLREKELM